MSHKKTPADHLRDQIQEIQENLVAANKLARTIPEADSVRPVISQAKDAFSQVGFSAEVGRL